MSSSIKLPVSSSRRSAVRFLKLLCRVRADAANGFEFEGRFLRPGGSIDESELPDPAILLEGAGSDGSGKRDAQYLYLLWRYDRKAECWRELGRVWAESTEWAWELGPLAERALQPASLAPDLSAIARKLAGLIEDTMRELEPKYRRQLASVLHDRFASQFTEGGEYAEAHHQAEAVHAAQAVHAVAVARQPPGCR